MSTIDFTLANAITSLFAVSFVFLAVILIVENAYPCVELPKPSTKEVVEGMSLVFLKGVIIGGLIVSAGWWLINGFLPTSSLNSYWPLIILAVFLNDLAYYWIHRSLNHSKGNHPIKKWYRKIHSTHHTVSELDFFRGNISSVYDTAMTGFQLPLIVIAAVLRLDFTSTIVAYGLVLMLQSTHHVNYTFNLGWLRYIFMDNHAHKLHHCKRGTQVNHGALFSLWDRAFGTFYEDWNASSNYMHFHGISIPRREEH